MSDITTIFLTRHGQTEWNILKKFQGHNDSALTELGINQAKWLGEALRDEKIDLIYSSSSLRTLRTAELLAEGRDIPIEACDELMELNLGVWEGLNQEEAKNSDPLQFSNFWNDPNSFKVQHSETFQEVSKRAVNKLQQIITENSGKSILLVTHTVVVKLIMAYFEKRELKDLWNPPYIHPTCLCKIEISQDRHSIILHGDITHYKEEAVES